MKLNIKQPILLLALCCLFAAIPKIANAHAPDQSYIYLKVHQELVEGQIQITTKDLNTALGLNLDPNLSMEDLQPYIKRIQNYATKEIQFSGDGQVFPIEYTGTRIYPTGPGTFVILDFELGNIAEVPDFVDLKYNILFEKDNKHQGLILFEYNWKAGIVNNESMVALVYSPNNTQQRLVLTEGSILIGFWAMVKLGMWHIWIGLDHILFLLALILPSVVRRRDPNENINSFSKAVKSWKPVSQFKPAFLYIIKIITFFTIAHSITLALAALEIINLPSRFVESIIALSIALAAFHNIRPIIKGREWVIAFVFGLFHGFGFASVLGEKGLSGEFLVISLFGFNVGVELGQLFIIFLIFPVLFFLRKLKSYPKLLIYGSILLIFISFYWAIERIFDVELQGGAPIKALLRSIGLM